MNRTHFLAEQLDVLGCTFDPYHYDDCLDGRQDMVEEFDHLLETGSSEDIAALARGVEEARDSIEGDAELASAMKRLADALVALADERMSLQRETTMVPPLQM